jgi:hypothetical protein
MYRTAQALRRRDMKLARQSALIVLAALAALAGCDKPHDFRVERPEALDPATLWEYELEREFDSGFQQLHGVDIGPDGLLYLSGSEGIRVFDPQGDLQSTMALGGVAHAVAFGEEGEMYVGLVDSVQVRGPEGALVRSWEAWQYEGRQHRFSDITDIAYMNASVYVADGFNKRVYRFSTVGDFMLEIGGEDETRLILPSSHLDVVPDPENNTLYINNPGLARIETRTPNGDLGTFWGGRGKHAEGFSGCCNPTDFDVTPGGYYVTTEKGIPRAKVYDSAGRMMAYMDRTHFSSTEVAGLDVAAESTERFYVADPGNQRMLVFKRVKGSDDQQPETE